MTTPLHTHTSHLAHTQFSVHYQQRLVQQISHADSRFCLFFPSSSFMSIMSAMSWRDIVLSKQTVSALSGNSGVRYSCYMHLVGPSLRLFQPNWVQLLSLSIDHGESIDSLVLYPTQSVDSVQVVHNVTGSAGHQQNG